MAVGGGDRLEVTLGAPAAGGGMVARDGDGRVLFVRHGLPGERVVASVTEAHATWARADAVEVLDASPDRVDAPCPYAGPGRCGGCDYQHAALPAQRELKRERVRDQLRGVAGLDLDVAVAALSPASEGLGTRTRVRFAIDGDGGLAMRRHRHHDLVPVARCLLATAGLDGAVQGGPWAPGAEVEAAVLAAGGAPTVTVTTGPPRARRREVRSGPPMLAATVGGIDYAVSPGVFWQVHVDGAVALVDAVLAGLALGPGDVVLDLYCGAGLFTAAAARAVGPTGRVLGVESDRVATRDAAANLSAWPWARAVTARVDRAAVRAAPDGVTHAVLDPPRRGADRGALAALCERTTLRRVVSVSCEPSTFARDLRVLVDGGFVLADVRAFDLFEMTEHVELVAVLARDV